MRSSRLFPSLTVAAALAVAAVGCGGSSTSDSAGDATTTIASAESETTAAAESKASTTLATVAAGPSGSVQLGSGGGEFCEKNREALKATLGGESELSASVMGAMADPVGNREKLRAMVADAKVKNKAIVADAPAEIKKELELMLQASTIVVDALEKANYDMSKIDLASATATISSPEFTAASTKVSAYLKDKCGIDVGM